MEALLTRMPEREREADMTTSGDRKMFSPPRGRSAMSPEGALAAVLGGYAAGATAAACAGSSFEGFATGARAPVRKRVADLLAEMEAAGTVERIPDGRYCLQILSAPSRA